MSINSVISDERGALLDGRQAWVFFVSGNGREGSKDFSRVAKKQLRKILIFLLLYKQFLKLKYIKLCGYYEHNEYSVSTERTA